MNSSRKLLEQARDEINVLYPNLALFVDGLGLHLSKREWTQEVKQYVSAYAGANGFKLVEQTAPWRPHLLKYMDEGDN